MWSLLIEEDVESADEFARTSPDYVRICWTRYCKDMKVISFILGARNDSKVDTDTRVAKPGWTAKNILSGKDVSIKVQWMAWTSWNTVSQRLIHVLFTFVELYLWRAGPHQYVCVCKLGTKTCAFNLFFRHAQWLIETLCRRKCKADLCSLAAYHIEYNMPPCSPVIQGGSNVPPIFLHLIWWRITQSCWHC